MATTTRKHGRPPFIPKNEDDTHEAEISTGEAAPNGNTAKSPRMEPASTRCSNNNHLTSKNGNKTEGVAKSESEAKKLWRSAKAVCFDVDSTVCVDEAIDELAAFLGKGKEVAELTQRAMSEGMSFRKALEARLNIIRPSRPQLERYMKEHPPKLTPGIKELVTELHRRNVPVFLVSGGFTRVILDVARLLNVPEENVYANVLHFDEAGEYAGFDESQPTSNSGGKTEVAAMLKSKFRFSPLIMIGDGATDMEASPPADAFIGFGGNQVRAKVKEGAPWFVTSFRTLLEELERE